MESLDQRVVLARNNSAEIESLLAEYLPMIKKQVSKTAGRGAEFEDLLSIAMLAFVNAVKQFDPGRGGFIGFARLCIQSRLLDELRRGNTARAMVIVDTETFDADQSASLARHQRESERRLLADEIAALRGELAELDIRFDSLAEVGPKQKRSKKLCFSAARRVLADAEMSEAFAKSARLVPGRLAGQLGVSHKTIEQYRRYIVTLVVIFKGDYPCIRTFLPMSEEVGE